MIHFLASSTSLSFYRLWHPLQGPGYQFWSGIASDLGEVTLLGAIGAAWHHLNCVEKGCWRKGHKDPEHGHPICRRHSRHASVRSAR